MATENRRVVKNNDDIALGCPPQWIWLLAGIVIGMFISFLVYIQQLNPENERPEQAIASVTSTPEVQHPDHMTQKEPPSELSPKFEFYDLLENGIEKVPEVVEESSNQESQASEAPTTSSAQYFLEVGSFRDKERAKGLIGYLASLNITATTTLDSTKSWHKVQVGPFSEKEQLKQIRAKLNEKNIPANIVQY